MKKILYAFLILTISSFCKFSYSSEAESKEQESYTFEELLSKATNQDKKTLLDIILEDAQTIKLSVPEWKKNWAIRDKKIKTLGSYGKQIADIIYTYDTEDLAATKPNIYISGFLQHFFKVIFDSLPEDERKNYSPKLWSFNAIVAEAEESELPPHLRFIRKRIPAEKVTEWRWD